VHAIRKWCDSNTSKLNFHNQISRSEVKILF
jgi:hypothetical protein